MAERVVFWAWLLPCMVLGAVEAFVGPGAASVRWQERRPRTSGIARIQPQVSRATTCAAASGSAAESTAPVVTLKLAVDKNGAVDDLGLTAKRFTSPESLDAVHRLRRDSDAVLVGVGTVVRDDPSLTVRRVAMPPNRPQPTRVVIDPTLRTPATSVLLTDGHPTIIVTDSAAAAPEDLKRALARAPEVTQIVRVPRMPASEGAVEAARVGGLELDKVLGVLEARGIRHLMVEGGPATARSFLHQGLVDRAILITAPVAFEVQPVPSAIDTSLLHAAGLRALATHSRWGPDTTALWLKSGAVWPCSGDPASWP